jgi:PKD repeat protein
VSYFPTQGGNNIKHSGKSIRKITLSVFTLVMIVAIFSAGASANVCCVKTELGDGTPPATQCLSCYCVHIDYTAVAASKKDPLLVQFKDLTKGKESYIGWEFGDGTSLHGTKITNALKNPVHKFKKKGRYISELTVRCSGKLLWVHYNVIIK